MSAPPQRITAIPSINLGSPSATQESSPLQSTTAEVLQVQIVGHRPDALRPFLPSPSAVPKFQPGSPGPRSGAYTYYASAHPQSFRDDPSRLSSPYHQVYPEAGFPTRTTLLKDPPPQVDSMTAFWSAYNEAGNIEDKAFVKASGGDLDTLLIFAGLFSGINTAFIIEAYNSLKADPREETNELIRSLIHATQNPSSPTLVVVANPFIPNARDIRINTCFFVSLCCSLTAAFGAVLAKQWLMQYDADGEALKPPSGRGRERQLKYENLKYWGLEHVVVTLPTLLQFSLFFFLIGLADLVRPLDTTISILVTAFTTLTFVFWLASILISTIFPYSPFQTRLSNLLRPTFASFIRCIPRAFSGAARLVFDNPAANLQTSPSRKWPVILVRLVRVGVKALSRRVRWTIASLSNVRFEKGRRDSEVVSRCVAHLLERETHHSELDALANVLGSLSDGMDCAKIAGTLLTFHLKPSFNEWWYLPGLQGPTRKPLLKILHTLFTKWGYLELGENTSIPSFPPVKSRQFLHSLRPELSKLSLAYPEDTDAHEMIMEILLVLPKFSPGYPNDYEGYSAIKWLETFITPFLQNDCAPVLQQRSLELFTAACASFDPHRTLKVIQPSLQACTGVQRFLCSTMWEDLEQKKVNLDSFWMGILRVQVLSVAPDDLFQSGFAEYLAVWFKHYAIPDWKTLVRNRRRIGRRAHEEEEQKWVYWSYLFALSQLLGGRDAQKWSQELGKYDHESCLRIILQDYPRESPFLGAPLATRSFLYLWNHSVPEAGLRRSSSSYLTEEHLRMIADAITFKDIAAISAKNLGPYGPVLFADTNTATADYRLSEEIAEAVTWLSSYFQVAMTQIISPARQIVGEALPHYRHWCEDLDRRRPGSHSHAHWENLLQEMENSSADEAEKDDLIYEETS